MPKIIEYSSEDWGTLTDSDNSIEYENDTLNMTVYAQNWFVWSTPNGEIYEDVHMEVTALNNDTDVTTAFGLMCHQQSDGDSSYYFAITPAGQYVIARATSGDDDFFSVRIRPSRRKIRPIHGWPEREGLHIVAMWGVCLQQRQFTPIPIWLCISTEWLYRGSCTACICVLQPP